MTPPNLPLKDGQKISTRNGEETIMGEIKVPHTEPICWTLQGNWYRRRDGEEMTNGGNEPITVREFYANQMHR
jgi:hypothetical protein